MARTPEQLKKLRELRKAQAEKKAAEAQAKNKEEGTVEAPKTGVTVVETFTKEEQLEALQEGARKAQLEWLQSHPPVTTPPPSAENITSFENAPAEVFEGFEYNGPDDGMERIQVQVTKDDIDAGRFKVVDLQRDGWVIDKSFLGGHLIRMKMPKEMLAKLRKGREDEYLRMLGGPQLPIKDADFKVTPEGPSITTEQVIVLTGKV